jgi:beta-galactosidase
MNTNPQSLSINDMWRFCLGEVPGAEDPTWDDSTWSEITVPHTRNADDMFPGKSAKESYIGPAW